MATKRYFIAYDLVSPGQNYTAVHDAISKSCGWYMKLQYSLYFVTSERTASDIYDRVRAVMDSNDKLAVIEAANAVISTAGDKQRADFLALWRSTQSVAA